MKNVMYLDANHIMFKEDNSHISRKLNKGDEATFEKIYKHFTPPLFSFASQYLSNEEAENVVQETMIWLWTNKKTIIPEMSLKSLLFTIVKNKCLNKIKSDNTKYRIWEEIKNKVSKQFDDPDFYYEQELMTLYKNALKTMPVLYLESFEMSRVQKMTHNEIAEALGMSKQTVNYRLSKALEHLRKELKEYLPIILALLS